MTDVTHGLNDTEEIEYWTLGICFQVKICHSEQYSTFPF